MRIRIVVLAALAIGAALGLMPRREHSAATPTATLTPVTHATCAPAGSHFGDCT